MLQVLQQVAPDPPLPAFRAHDHAHDPWRPAAALGLVELVIDRTEPDNSGSITGRVDADERHRQLTTRAGLPRADFDERGQVLGPVCPLLPPEQANLFQQLRVIGK